MLQPASIDFLKSILHTHPFKSFLAIPKSYLIQHTVSKSKSFPNIPHYSLS